MIRNGKRTGGHRWEQVKELHNRGLRVDQIADAMGVDWQLIAQDVVDMKELGMIDDRRRNVSQAPPRR